MKIFLLTIAVGFTSSMGVALAANVEFSADTDVLLTGLNAGDLQIVSGSEAASFNTTATTLTVNGVTEDTTFVLKTPSHSTALSLTPVGGSAGFSLGNANISADRINSWTLNAVGTTSVGIIIAVEKANTLYQIKIDGGNYQTATSTGSNLLSFSYTGGEDGKIFTFQDASTTPTLSYNTEIFKEATTNDGSIITTQTVTLANDTFADPLSLNTHVIMSNVPSGLTPILTRVSDTEATFSFHGNANNHALSDEVSNLSIVWQNGAFVSTPVAGGVINYSKNNFRVDFVDQIVGTGVNADGSLSQTNTQTSNLQDVSSLIIRDTKSNLVGQETNLGAAPQVSNAIAGKEYILSGKSVNYTNTNINSDVIYLLPNRVGAEEKKYMVVVPSGVSLNESTSIGPLSKTGNPTITGIDTKVSISVPTSASSVRFSGGNIDVCVPGTNSSLGVGNASEVLVYYSIDRSTWEIDTSAINKQFTDQQQFCFQTNHLTDFALGKKSSYVGAGGSRNYFAPAYVEVFTQKMNSGIQSLAVPNIRCRFTNDTLYERGGWDLETAWMKIGNDFVGVRTEVKEYTRPLLGEPKPSVVDIVFDPDIEITSLTKSPVWEMSCGIQNMKQQVAGKSFTFYDPYFKKQTYTAISPKEEREGCFSKKFVDVSQERWSFPYVSEVYCRGIMMGYHSLSRFGATDPTTRSQLLKVGLELLNIEVPISVSRSPFLDVPISRWDAPYLEKAKELGVTGIFTSQSNNIYPDKPITRGEALQVLLELADIDVSKFEIQKDEDSASLPFTDFSRKDEFAPYVLWAVNKNIVEGYKGKESKRQFGPYDPLTREQLAKILVNFINVIEGEK